MSEQHHQYGQLPGFEYDPLLGMVRVLQENEFAATGERQSLRVAFTAARNVLEMLQPSYSSMTKADVEAFETWLISGNRPT